ncbi:MAG TPA: IPT/TIG domain-containing protein [Puia sp.]|nr:IPT/TIG domain-containing protein [Puia sp.]
MMKKKIFFAAAVSLILASGCAKQFAGNDDTVRLTIDSISPTSGQAGTAVLIYGKGFSSRAADNKVFFHSLVKATVDSNASFNVIRVYAPNSPYGGAAPISVVVDGDSVSGPVFTYVTLRPPPVITGVIYDQAMNITGNNFDSLGSLVTIGGQIAGGFSFLRQNGQTVLHNATYKPAANLDNPVNITVTVGGVVSNAWPYLFYPQITGFTYDTVQANKPVTINGALFGSRTVPSSVRAYYIDGNFRQVYMSPDPAVVSWTTNAIKITMPNYSSYAVGVVRIDIYLEVDVSTKNASSDLYYYR